MILRKFEQDLKNIIKPDDELILLREDIKIMTDREGKIKDINIKLVSKKDKEYCYLYGGNDTK